MSIAESLNGKPVNLEEVNVIRDKVKGVYIFDDGSRGKIITEFEKCEPYLSKSLSTMSNKPVYRWKAINDQSKT